MGAEGRRGGLLITGRAQVRSVVAGRGLQLALGGTAALAALFLVVLAAFPWGILKSPVERALSDRVGRPVAIGRIERDDHFSLTPTVAIRDVRVPQAAWAGTGDLARVDRAEITFRALPLLIGRFRPTAIRVSGVRLALARAKDGRTNWNRPGAPASGAGPLQLSGLNVTDTLIDYRDAKVDRSFTVRVEGDPARGLRLAGNGIVLGRPVRVSAAGAAIDRADGGPWHFRAGIDGPALGVDAVGTMDAALDLGGMSFDLTAHAENLKLIDAVIEAGLIGTQPVRLKAHVRHDAPDWSITALSGTIGRSDIAGRLTVKKRGGRTLVDGDVVSNALDFDDLASDAGQAAAIAQERAIGLRLVPATRINIRRIWKTDATIRFAARRLLGGRRPSSLTSLKGVATIERQLLTVSDIVLGLRKGTITGSFVVDQRGRKPLPDVTIDLALNGSSIGALVGEGDVAGRVDGRAKLVGRGSTLREVVGRSHGTIGVVARDGSLPARLAALIGFDAGRALTSGSEDRAVLRCLAVRLDMRGGTGRTDPFIVDTSASQSRGQGTISFPSEALAIQLTGAPKQNSLLRLPGSATLAGTIRDPKVEIPAEVKSVGTILKAIGRTITGRQGPLADDADCAALSARVLRG